VPHLINVLLFVLCMHRLGVTGHSLGAALATLFGFYAATDQRVLQNGKPVEVFSFASPFVGDDQFRTAFKMLEHEGKLVHARIVNAHDFVPMLPIISPKVDLEQKLTTESWDVTWYKHVGLRIFLA
jgi:predicted lipase